MDSAKLELLRVQIESGVLFPTKGPDSAALQLAALQVAAKLESPRVLPAAGPDSSRILLRPC
jgi:hypothetical protein